MKVEKQPDGSWKPVQTEEEVLWFLANEKARCERAGEPIEDWLVPLMQNAGLLPKEEGNAV